MARARWTDRELSEDDIHTLRCFLRQSLIPFIEHVRDFYYSLDYISMETGFHTWALREKGAALGYMVVRSGPKDFTSTTVFPYVNPSKVDIGVPGGTKPAVLQEILKEPLDVEDFYAYYKRRRICFLTKELHEAEFDRIALQSTVFLSREEAFALLNGETLELTLDKVRKAFGIRRVT